MTKHIYRTAIIGLGAVGKRMLTHIMDHQRFEPLVGLDVRSDSLDNFERPVRSFKLTEDMSALLGTRGIDLLYVSTPPKFHAQAIYDGLSNNWNILCEKPLRISLSKSQNLVQIIENHYFFKELTLFFRDSLNVSS
ncbi:MAG: Gfo/Idh/MocA family oxidoreductase [SAR324 cluster bacterium]|nr:Gfo/Idh/MocA family oxidoreductase [SAR324 cluster bacterium]